MNSGDMGTIEMQNAKKSAKKKICIIMGGHFSATIGGAQYQAKCIVEELKKADSYDIYYLARVIDPTYQPVGYKILKIADRAGIRKHAFFFDARHLLRLLNEIKPDVIYQRGLKSYTGIAAYYAGREDCKMIFHAAHDDDVQTKKISWRSLRSIVLNIENLIAVHGLKRVEHIVVQTQQQADLLHACYKRKISALIPNFHPSPKENLIKSKPIKVAWVANFKPSKRPEVFVQLAADLNNLESVEFIMIGRQGEKERYKDLHQKIASLSNLSYLGELPIEEVNQLLAKAHIFVNTSVAEGFPNTFIQAWMRKVPVVSMTFNADDVLDKNNIGFFGGDSYAGVKIAVEKLIQNESLCKDMGERAQSYAFKNYSQKNAERLISVIES